MPTRATAASRRVPIGMLLGIVFRRGAHPVVQVKKHRRTLGRCREQVLELPERAGPNSVALEGCRQPSVRALGGENIEVVHPELDHDFLKLPPAVNRPQDLFLGQLHDDAPRPFDFHRARLWGLHGHCRRRTVALCGGLLALGLGPLLRRRVVLNQFLGGHLERRERSHFRLHGRVVKPFRMQLLVEKGGKPHPAETLQVAGPRPEGDSIQELQRLLVVVQWLTPARFFAQWGGRLLHGEKRTAERLNDERGRQKANNPCGEKLPHLPNRLPRWV